MERKKKDKYILLNNNYRRIFVEKDFDKSSENDKSVSTKRMFFTYI